jgi:hemerythrin-like domain-containing protein
MPVQIGASSASFSNPTGLLSDCHRRVEMFLNVLISVAETAHQELTPENKASLENALRYFRDAAPKHTADEEVSLFPRLRKIDDPALQAALRELDALEHDHRWAEPLHARVDELALEYLRDGKLNAEPARELQQALAQLASMYARHIQREEVEVFPLAAQLLSPEQKKEIALEMSARRNPAAVS